MIPTLAVTAALLLPADEETANLQLHQVAWLPDLAEAKALAAREGRPLFLAVNMDGESASERIVREIYRDPEFVAMTRHVVCLMSSVFRHTPRDYDDQGRRIPCPRIGRITCGEHMALEPILYDAYLGGDRIAPVATSRARRSSASTSRSSRSRRWCGTRTTRGR